MALGQMNLCIIMVINNIDNYDSNTWTFFTYLD